MKFHVMTGTPAGKNFYQFFTDAALLRLAKFVGIRSKWGRRRLHPSELGQMKFGGRLKLGAELFVSEYRERDSLNKRNRELMLKRGEGRVCPHKYTLPCYACHVGFKDCSLAARQYTLDRKMCPKCHEFGYFDPRDPGFKICLHCQIGNWRRAG